MDTKKEKVKVNQLLTIALINPSKTQEIINKLSKKIKYIQKTLEIITETLSSKDGADFSYKTLYLNLLRDCINQLGIPFACQLNDGGILNALWGCYSEHQELKNSIDVIINLMGYMVGFHKDELDLTNYYHFVKALKPTFQWVSRKPENDFEKSVHEALEVLSRCKKANLALLKPASIISNREDMIVETLVEIETIRSSLDFFKPDFKPIQMEFIDDILLKIGEFEEIFLPLAKKAHKNLDEVLLTKKISQKTEVPTHSGSDIELHKRTYFFYNEILTEDEGENIEYKNYHYPFSEILTKTLAKAICSFLNQKGGRIYIGVQDEQKMVCGLTLTAKDRDNLKREICDTLLNNFYPNISHEDFVKVEFIPVYDVKSKKAIPGRVVVKIIVKQGDGDQLYSVTQSALKCFIRKDGFCKNLDAAQIISVLRRRWGNNGGGERIDPKEFNDPKPEKLEEIIYESAAKKREKQLKTDPSKFPSQPQPFKLPSPMNNKPKGQGIGTPEPKPQGQQKKKEKAPGQNPNPTIPNKPLNNESGKLSADPQKTQKQVASSNQPKGPASNDSTNAGKIMQTKKPEKQNAQGGVGPTNNPNTRPNTAESKKKKKKEEIKPNQNSIDQSQFINLFNSLSMNTTNIQSSPQLVTPQVGNYSSNQAGGMMNPNYHQGLMNPIQMNMNIQSGPQLMTPQVGNYSSNQAGGMMNPNYFPNLMNPGPMNINIQNSQQFMPLQGGVYSGNQGRGKTNPNYPPQVISTQQHTLSQILGVNTSTQANSSNQKEKPKTRDRPRSQPKRLPEEPTEVTFGFKITGLPPDVTDEEFASLFKEYEQTRRPKVMRDKISGECQGYGFINFTDLEIGNKVMERFNNAKTAINESALTMERQQKEVKYGFKLSGLPADVTDEEIEALFEEYKTHCKVVTMRNTENGTCRGHAWIDFTDLAIGANAMKRIQNERKMIKDCPLTMELYQKHKITTQPKTSGKSEEAKEVTYGFKISGLPPDVTDEELATLLQEYELVRNPTIVRNKVTGVCVGWAFANFSDLEIGARVMNEIHEKKTIRDSTLTMELSK